MSRSDRKSKRQPRLTAKQQRAVTAERNMRAQARSDQDRANLVRDNSQDRL